MTEPAHRVLQVQRDDVSVPQRHVVHDNASRGRTIGGQDGAASAQRATASLLGFRTRRRKSREPGGAGGSSIRPRITCNAFRATLLSAVARRASSERAAARSSAGTSFTFYETFKRPILRLQKKRSERQKIPFVATRRQHGAYLVPCSRLVARRRRIRCLWVASRRTSVTLRQQRR